MPSSFSRFSIRTQVLLLVLAVILPVAAMFAWFRFDDARHAREDARREVSIVVASAARDLARFLGQTEATLARLAARPQVRALDPKRCDPIVAEFIKLNPEFTTLGIRDLDGNSVCSYLPNPIARLNPRDFPWFEEGLRAGTFVAGNAFRGRQVGRWVSVLTHPIRDDAGKVIGLLALPVDLLKLGDQVFGGVPKNTVVAVIDLAANYLPRSANPALFIGTPSPAPVMDATRGLREGFLSVEGPDGVRRVYAYATLPNAGWRIAAGVPESDVFAQYHLRLRRNLAIGIGVLLLVLGLGWRISNAITRPITALAGVAGRVATGDTTVRAQIAGPAEVAAVAQQVNGMLDARDRDEAALRDSEENLAITLQSIGDAVIATDARGRVTRMNPTAERLTGCPLAEAVGRPLAEVFHIINSQTRMPAPDPVQQVLASGTVVALANHTALLARDGGEYQIFDSAAPIRNRAGQLVGVVLVFADVTEQYRVRQALQASEERLRTLIEWSPEPVRVHRNNVVIYVNPAAIKLFGASSAQELVGKSVFDRIHPDSREEARARLAATRDGDFLAPKAELQFTRLDGSVIDVEVQGTTIDFEGQPAVHASLHDITERKRADATRSALEAQLRESQKMEAIGTLAGGIAHDFNNIIGTVLGNTELARHDAGSNPAVQESLEEIRKAGHRARDLVQQILSFSRRQPTDRKPIALGAVVEESVRLLRATLPARVQVEGVVSTGVGLTTADATQIEQVLLNLGVNASQAMGGRAGHIEIRVEPITLNAPAAALLAEDLKPGAYARVSVSDDGDGMDEATMKRIFEPFFTTKPLGEGTGLGLAVVHGIVRAHEGALAVRSESGKGSRFDVYLPAASGTAAATDAAAPATAMPEGRGQQVLYIDDDQALVFLVTRLLGKRGYRVSGHVDQLLALDELRADPGRFHLVVTDYNMPGLSGLDVVRAVHEIRPDLPVALASGFITDELKAKALQAGVVQLIFKANAVEEFCAVVQRLVAAPAKA